MDERGGPTNLFRKLSKQKQTKKQNENENEKEDAPRTTQLCMKQ